jgi:hypothetical protein
MDLTNTGKIASYDDDEDDDDDLEASKQTESRLYKFCLLVLCKASRPKQVITAQNLQCI